MQQPKFHFTLLPGNSQLKPTLGSRDFFCFVLRETIEHNFECTQFIPRLIQLYQNSITSDYLINSFHKQETNAKTNASVLLDI
jgi:hypothetical protein